MSEPIPLSAERALNLLRMAARVDPLLRQAVADVELHIDAQATEIAALKGALGAYRAWPEIKLMLTAKGVNKPIITDGEQGYCRVCHTEWHSPSMESHAPLHWDFLNKEGLFKEASVLAGKEAQG